MNNEKLAPVYLDNKPVNLQDPKPKVSTVLSAGGKPDATDVKWLQFQPATQGKSMRPEEILDRTSEPSKPIYLTSTAKGQPMAGKSQPAVAPGAKEFQPSRSASVEGRSQPAAGGQKAESRQQGGKPAAVEPDAAEEDAHEAPEETEDR